MKFEILQFKFNMKLLKKKKKNKHIKLNILSATLTVLSAQIHNIWTFMLSLQKWYNHSNVKASLLCYLFKQVIYLFIHVYAIICHLAMNELIDRMFNWCNVHKSNVMYCLTKLLPLHTFLFSLKVYISKWWKTWKYK
jgi:phage-related protein